MFKELKFPLDISQSLPNRILEEGQSDYKFGCSSENWNFPDSCKIYKVIDKNPELLYDSTETHAEIIKSEIRNRLFSDNMGKTLFLSAHFIPNLFDRYYIGNEPLKTTQIALSLMQELKEQKNICVDFGILIDDLYMMNDYVRLKKDKYNHYRKLFFDSFVLPTKLAEMLNSYHNNFDFNVIYGTEKTFADVFHRNIKNIKHNDIRDRFATGKNYTGYKETDWFYKYSETLIKIENDNKPNCVSAVASMLKNISYKLDNRVKTQMYDSVVAFFPSCSVYSALNGTKVAMDFYNLKLNVSLIFTTNKCF